MLKQVLQFNFLKVRSVDHYFIDLKMFCLKIFERQIAETSIHIYAYIFVYMYIVLVVLATKKDKEEKRHIYVCKNQV